MPVEVASGAEGCETNVTDEMCRRAAPPVLLKLRGLVELLRAGRAEEIAMGGPHVQINVGDESVALTASVFVPLVPPELGPAFSVVIGSVRHRAEITLMTLLFGGNGSRTRGADVFLDLLRWKSDGTGCCCGCGSSPRHLWVLVQDMVTQGAELLKMRRTIWAFVHPLGVEVVLPVVAGDVHDVVGDGIAGFSSSCASTGDGGGSIDVLTSSAFCFGLVDHLERVETVMLWEVKAWSLI